MTPIAWGPRARRIVVYLGCCLLSLAIASPVSSDEGPSQAQSKVTVGVPESFPPYYQLDEDGTPSGFAISVMNEVAKRAGLKIAYRVKKNWGEIFKALRTGDIDIVPNLGITERRKEYAAFTVPLETFHVSIFVRDDTHDVKDLGDLSGRPVAVVATNAARRILESRDDIQLRVFDNFTEALFALLSAEVDALAFPEPVTWKLAREARVDKQIKVVGEPLKEIKRGMAVPKDKVELLAVLDQVVKDFVASPEYRKIYVAWFGKPDPDWTVARVAWAMGGVMAVFFVLMVWWRYQAGVRMIRALQKKDERLSGAIESLQEGFVLFDAEDRLVTANDVYRRINPKAQELLDKGLGFEDCIRANVERGWIVEAIGREEEFIRERLEQHRNPKSSILRRFADGKWYILKEARTREGGTALTFTDITELQSAKAAREKLSEAIENVPVGIALFDSDDRLVFFNNRYGELMEVMADILKPGVTFEEIIRTIVDRQPVKDARGREEEFIPERIKHHRDPTGPFDIRRENMWLMANEIRLSDGGIFTIITDVTERKKAEEALLESEERFRIAFENAPVGMALITPEGRRFKVNKALADFLGYTVEELTDTSMKSTAADLDALDKSMRLRQRVLDGEMTTYRNERRYRHKQGHVVWGEVSGSLFRNEDGEPEYFIAHTIDITEQKLAEQALQESEDRLRRAVIDAPIPIMIHADDGEVLMISQMWTDLTGYTHAEIPTIAEWTEKAYGKGGIIEESRERIEALYDIEAKTGEGEYFITTKNGEPQTWDFRSSPLGKLRDGRSLVISMAMDVTERKRTEDALRQAMVDAEQANQAKSEFLATMSHEFRTPLNAILGFAEILTHKYFGPINDKYREYAEDIQSSGEHLLTLVNEILDLSTIEAGKQSLVKEKLSTAEIIKECKKIIEDKARSKGIDLITEVPKDLPPLYADKRASKQILLNLLSNAIKFTAQGGKITMSAKASKRNTTLTITDTGKGIPAEKLPKLTDPFTRGDTDPYLAEEGWGLGLTITKSLVELHDGKLDIRSKIGKGTTVTVTLPNGAP